MISAFVISPNYLILVSLIVISSFWECKDTVFQSDMEIFHELFLKFLHFSPPFLLFLLNLRLSLVVSTKVATFADKKAGNNMFNITIYN